MNVHVKTEDPRRYALLKIADAIEGQYKFLFNMGSWDCCIAGICVRMFADIAVDTAEIALFARNFFKLTIDEAEMLFTPDADDLGLPRPDYSPASESAPICAEVSGAWAANTLRYFAFTGKIDWITCKPAPVKELHAHAHPVEDLASLCKPVAALEFFIIAREIEPAEQQKAVA